jgi:hypothetical protein
VQANSERLSDEFGQRFSALFHSSLEGRDLLGQKSERQHRRGSARTSEESGKETLRLLISKHGMRTEAFDRRSRAVATPGKAIPRLRVAQVDDLEASNSGCLEGAAATEGLELSRAGVPEQGGAAWQTHESPKPKVFSSLKACA